MKELTGWLVTSHTPRTLLMLSLTAFIACDPAMTIRQTNAVVESENAVVSAIPKISVDVTTTHQFIGEYWYGPRVLVTNLSDFPITIIGVELVSGGVTYENRPRVARYPLNVPSHDASLLDVYFRFGNGVDQVFKSPGELRFHYSSHQGSGVARITVAAGPLNAK